MLNKLVLLSSSKQLPNKPYKYKASKSYDMEKQEVQLMKG